MYPLLPADRNFDFTVLENNPELVKNQGIQPIISLFPVPEETYGTGKRQKPENEDIALTANPERSSSDY